MFIVFSLYHYGQVPVPTSESPRTYVMESMPSIPPRSSNDIYIRSSNGKSQLIKGNDTPISDFYDKIDYVYNVKGNLDKAYVAKKGNSYALLNQNGQPITAFEFDNVDINDQYLAVQKKGLWGIINNKGEVIVPFKFSNILYYNSQSNQLLAIKDNATAAFFVGNKELKIPTENAIITEAGIIYQKNGKFGLLNPQEKNSLPAEYDAIKTYGYNNYESPIKGSTVKLVKSPLPFFALKKNNLFGLADAQGKIVAPVQYDEVTYEIGRNYYLLNKNKLKGLYLPQNTPLFLDAVYNALYPSYTNNAIVAIKDGKYGLLDKSGKVMLPFEYESIMDYNTDRFLVKKNGRQGMVGSKGNVLIPIEYNDISSFGGFNFSDYYFVKKDNLYGIMKANGQVILPVKFTWVGDYGQMIVGELNKKWSLYDEQGFLLTPEPIDYLARNYGSYPVYYMVKDGKYGLINSNGKILEKIQFKSLDYLYDEDGMRNPGNGSPLVVRSMDNKLGLFDERSQKMLITPSYDDLTQIADGNIVAKKGSKYGIIKSNNTVVIPFEYDAIDLNWWHSKNPSFIAKKNGKYGVVDLKNTPIIPFEYTALEKVSLTLYKASKGKNFSLINVQNKVINAGPFEAIQPFEENKTLAFQNGKMVVLDEKGTVDATGINGKAPVGYKNFQELKNALITALNSKEDQLLKDFSQKVSPNIVTQYYLKNNLFTSGPLEHTDPNEISKVYFNALLRFKNQYWNTGKYDKTELTNVNDFEVYERGRITNDRASIINDFRNNFLTEFLKDAIKINGLWYSSYFMKRDFGRF